MSSQPHYKKKERKADNHATAKIVVFSAEVTSLRSGRSGSKTGVGYGNSIGRWVLLFYGVILRVECARVYTGKCLAIRPPLLRSTMPGSSGGGKLPQGSSIRKE